LELVLHLCPLVGVGSSGLKARDAGPGTCQFSIQCDKALLIRRNVFLCVNGIHRALWNTDRAVNALIGIDDEKIGALSETVDGTDVYAVGVSALDAGFSNDVGHDLGFSPHNGNFTILADL
jgi:hypothetical protein